MSVFLRWGVFGILSVAGLLYAYNASKDLAQRRPPPVVTVAPAEAAQQAQAMPVSQNCDVEVVVAQRAIEARDAGDPLDRLLRTREIAFETDEKRRERLTQVAKRWFGYAEAIGPFSVRRAAAAECEQSAVVTKP
ncbi:MAG: hypothetical protein H7Y89_01220 [Steroidobacteraceae bacterium]|nr:hypothetical protein [Steroidobacteraceae bacterium]